MSKALASHDGPKKKQLVSVPMFKCIFFILQLIFGDLYNHLQLNVVEIVDDLGKSVKSEALIADIGID